ncbi:hypothetical protein XENOCAPTIV_011156, partial [Xenoophorus captivus]
MTPVVSAPLPRTMAFLYCSPRLRGLRTAFQSDCGFKSPASQPAVRLPESRPADKITELQLVFPEFQEGFKDQLPLIQVKGFREMFKDELPLAKPPKPQHAARPSEPQPAAKLSELQPPAKTGFRLDLTQTLSPTPSLLTPGLLDRPEGVLRSIADLQTSSSEGPLLCSARLLTEGPLLCSADLLTEGPLLCSTRLV